jgi:hypothetical protein
VRLLLLGSVQSTTLFSDFLNTRQHVSRGDAAGRECVALVTIKIYLDLLGVLELDHETHLDSMLVVE